jgi:hypothetical protein
VRDDLDVRIPRLVVANLLGDDALDVALRCARAATVDGTEVVYLGTSDAAGTAWAVRAEDAGRVAVVADEVGADAVRAALLEVGLVDVDVEVVPPR